MRWKHKETLLVTNKQCCFIFPVLVAVGRLGNFISSISYHFMGYHKGVEGGMEQCGPKFHILEKRKCLKSSDTQGKERYPWWGEELQDCKECSLCGGRGLRIMCATKCVTWRIEQKVLPRSRVLWGMCGTLWCTDV